MTEENVIEQPKQTEIISFKGNPMDDSAWKTAPPAVEPPKPAAEASPVVEPSVVTPPPAAEPTEEIFDANDWLKKELGFDNVEAAKAALEERKFPNEESRKYFDALKEGNEDKIYDFLNNKKELERAEKLDITKVREAEEILKLSLKYKNKDLQPDEIDWLFNQEFKIPAKPVQSDTQLDDDYEKEVKHWEQQVKEIEKGIVIKAKLAKPELSKFKQELVLPDIPKPTAQAAEPTQEELKKFNDGKVLYEKDVQAGLQAFNELSTTYKDEEVEIPIAYKIDDAGKAKIKSIMEGLYSGFDYFTTRWSKKDGGVDTALIAKDIAKLEFGDEAMQKAATEAGTQRLKHEMKIKSNVNLKNGNGQTQIQNQTAPKDDKGRNPAMLKFIQES